jgi:hypothetical protein
MKGQEYFAMLNEVEQEQFEMNFATCRLDNDDLGFFLNDEYDDFDTFISCAFLFAKTPQGTDYWRTIRDSQRDGVDASARRNGNPKSMEELMAKLLFLALEDSIEESKSKELSFSLDDILSDLKIKLSDD